MLPLPPAFVRTLLPLLAALLIAAGFWPGSLPPVLEASTAASPLAPPPQLAKGHPKLNGRLHARQRARAQRDLRRLLPSGLLLALAPAGKVQAVAEFLPGRLNAVRRQIEQQGGTVELVSGNRVQFADSLEGVERLLSSADIRLLREPYPAYAAAINGQGVAGTGASDWHNAGYTGRGLKIGVLDAGFAGYTSRLGTELPAAVVAHSVRADRDITGGGEVHGTGVAEVVHEMAPDASLVLVNYSNDMDFGAAVSYLRGQQVDIITNSTGSFVWGPGDGTGPVNQHVTAAVQDGIFWSQAAGNHARRHWGGAYGDSNGNGWHNFTASADFNPLATFVAAGSLIQVELKWNDPYGASCTDFDLYLLDPDLRVIDDPLASSLGPQTCTQDPVEIVQYLAPRSGVYSIGIARYDLGGIGPNPQARLDLYTPSHNLTHQTPANSLTVPADNALAVTVGAHDWTQPNVVEAFSSQGPTADGRIKPDLLGPDGIANSTYGQFFGTSAATPHAGAAAALVQQAHPDHSPSQTAAFLRERAADVLAPGADNVSGAGRLTLGTPPLAIDPATALTSAPVAAPADGTTVVPVTVVVRDTGGAPAVGKPVALVSPRGAIDRIVPAVALTNLEGRASFDIMSSTPGTASLAVRAVAEDAGLGSVPVAFVAGPPTLTVSPPSGPPRRELTVAGAGFAPNLNVELRWSDDAALMVFARANTAGAFSATVTPPTGPPGAHTVRAVQGLVAATSAYTVFNAALSVAPTAGASGAAVVFTGVDFYPTLPVEFRLGATLLGSAPASSAGRVTLTTTIPAVAGGSHLVEAVQYGVETLMATTALTVIASPSLAAVTSTTAGQGALGRTLMLQGGHFADGMTLSVSGTGVSVRGVTVNDTSSATAAIDVAPDAALGPRDLTVRNPDGGAATLPAALVVMPRPSIAHVQVTGSPPGSAQHSVAVLGTGFAAGLQVSISGTGVHVIDTIVTAPDQVTGELRFDGDAAVGPRDLTISNLDGGRATARGVVRVLGKLGEPAALALMPAGIEASFATAQPIPAGGSITIVLVGPGSSTAAASSPSLMVNDAPCATTGTTASITSVSVRLAASCDIAAGQAVRLNIAGILLPPPPTAVTVHVTTIDATGGALDAGQTVAYQPVLALTPSHAAPDETVRLRGSGFPPGRDIALAAAPAIGLSTRVASGDDGGLSAQFVVPPSTESGIATVTAATGLLQTTAKLIVVASPVVTISPPAGSATGQFTVHGVGLIPSETVTVTWGTGVSVVLLTGVADAAGRLRAVLTPPTGVAPGFAQIAIAGASGRTTAANYTITSAVATLRGRVTGSNGDGVARAKGWANSASGVTSSGPYSVPWTSDENGDFAVELPEGAYNVGVVADGRAMLTPERAATLAADGSQQPAVLTFEAAPADQVHQGMVVGGTDGAAVPVAGATVVATGAPVAPGGPSLRSQTYTDRGGIFRFALPGTHAWTLQPSVDGIPAVVTAETQGRVSDAGPPRVYQVAPTVTLRGNVSRAGIPARDIPLVASGDAAMNTVSGQDGRYALTLPRPAAGHRGSATYRVLAGSGATGYARFELDVPASGAVVCQPHGVEAVCPAPGAPDAGPDIVLPDNGIHVRLSGPGGSPLPEAVALLAQATNGSYSAAHRARTRSGMTLPLPAGVYDVGVIIPGLVRSSFSGVTSPGTVLVELPPTVVLRGSVEGPSGGRGGASVIVQSVADPGLAPTVQTCTAALTAGCATGSFSLTVPANGSFQVMASQAGYLSSPMQPVTVGNTAVPPMTLTLTPLADAPAVSGPISGIPTAAAVTVTATLSDGRAVAASRGAWAEGCSAPTGGYCLRLPPGTWRLSAAAHNAATTGPGPTVTVPAIGPLPVGPSLALAPRAATATTFVSASIAATAGGQALATDGASIAVPSGAITDASGAVLVAGSVITDVAGAGGLFVAGGRALQIDLRDTDGRRLTSFAQPLAIRSGYGDLIAAGTMTAATAARLTCARYDTVLARWMPLPGINDPSQRMLTCFTYRLSKIAALTDTPSVTPAPAQPAGGGGGGGGGSSSPSATPVPAPTPTPAPTATAATLAADGSGTLAVSNVQAAFAAGSSMGAALRATLALVDVDDRGSIQAAAVDSTPMAHTPIGMIIGTTAFRLTVQDAAGAAVLQIARPATLTVGYRGEDTRRAANGANRLSLARWDDNTGAWVGLATKADASAALLSAQSEQSGLFAVLASVPAPALTGPAAGSVSVDMAPALRWQTPPGTRWHQVQIVPFNNDGPGINMLIGDPEQVAAARFAVPPPRFGQGDYILLPGMTYTWRVRVSPAPWAVTEHSAGWSAWSERPFRTGAASSAGINLVAPPAGALTTSRTPTLCWSNTNDRLFYYEVQLSRDPNFEADPALAIAAVYWNLVHGGLTQPPNSWTATAAYPLDANAIYYWRIRPRVQGDGAPVAWSATSSFKTP